MTRTIVFPLRSNAKSLVTGAALASVRRRLKAASVLYDAVLLEHGSMSIQAGTKGSSAFWRPSSDAPRFQTPGERGAAQGSDFTLMVGTESVPGEAATNMVPIVHSDTAVCWEPTLEPFRSELPANADWIDWVHAPDPNPDGRRIADAWSRRDRQNSSLREAIPIEFVRSCVIKHGNRDLVLAAGTGALCSQDDLHSRVSEQRLNESQSSWQIQGFALPVLVPDVGHLPWDEIVAARKHRAIARLRSVLAEIEGETWPTAVDGGDVERAVHLAAERRLAAAAAATDSIGTTAKKTLLGLVVGAGSGVATLGITGPLGAIAGAGLGSTIGGVLDVSSLLRERRTRDWTGLLCKLQTMTS